MTRRWSQVLVEAIDPVLAGSPFGAGQTGEPPLGTPGWLPRAGASVIWCGGYREVVEAYPHLDLADESVEDHWCFDLTVEIDRAGRLCGVALEGEELQQILEGIDRTVDARTVAGLMGVPAESAVPALADVLARVFTPGPTSVQG